MSTLSPKQALQEADRCVKCGMCLPHCPTYGLYADENESPRGRLALAEALLRGQLPPDQGLADHLHHCLLCRRCETACPSGVEYAKVIDTARRVLPASHWSSRLVTHRKLQQALIAIAQRLPLPTVSSRLARALPSQQAPRPGHYPSLVEGTTRGTVGLLLGCVTRVQQGNALNATLRLLQTLGYEVVLPSDQQCCGALHYHQGDPHTAQQLEQANRRAFEGLDQVVSIASGCSLHLRDQDFAPTVIDVVEFLSMALAQNPLTFNRLEASAALHLPCSLVNGLGKGSSWNTLLSKIAGLKITPLGTPGDCCGAAGDHLLSQRAQATQLREPLLQQLLKTQPNYLVSANIGCILHLAEGAQAAGMSIECLHPVELLYQCLRK